jgi:hypothetical protein
MHAQPRRPGSGGGDAFKVGQLLAGIDDFIRPDGNDFVLCAHGLLLVNKVTVTLSDIRYDPVFDR